MSEIRLQVSNLITYQEAGGLLDVSRQTIHAMIKRGELHPFIIADRRFLLREEVERLAHERHDIERLKECN
jgi:excisionase family DNA binding protein